MDEAYASPDSDGHASLPSPTDSTFDLSQLPLKRRGRPQDPIIVSSSFMRTQEDDSDDDSEGDVTFSPNTLTKEHQHRMLQSPPPLPTPTKSRTKVLTPMNYKNDDNTPRTTPRRPTQSPGKSQATSPGQGENIDPMQGQGSKGKPSPPRLVLRRPDYGSSDEEEEASVDKTDLMASDLAPETVIKDDTLPAVASSPETKKAASKRVLVWKSRNSPTKTSSPSRSGPASSPAPTSSHQDLSKLPGPDEKSHLTPSGPHVRYLNWLSSDSIDDADDESITIPVGHTSRLKKAQSQRILDETAFLGGDEASLLAGDMDINNEMLEIFHRASPGEVEEPEGVSLSILEEPIPAASLPPIMGAATDAASGSDAGSAKEPASGTQDPQHTANRTEDFLVNTNTRHPVSPTGSPRREVQQPTPSNDDQSRSFIPSPLVQEPIIRPQTLETIVANETSSIPITPVPSDIIAGMETGSYTSFIPTEITTSVQEFTQPTTSVPNKGKRTTRPKSFSDGNPTSRQSFGSNVATRPATSPGQLQENSMAAAFAASPQNPHRESPEGDTDLFPETNTQHFSYSEGFVAQSTPKDYYDGYDIWAIKKSGRGRRVSMNTPPSTLGRSLSGTEILNDPEFSSLGSGFTFPSQPLRYEEWNPESVANEFTPPFPVEGLNGVKRLGLRPPGVEAPHNTPTPSTGKGSGPPAGWVNLKAGKGRARSKSDPVENKLGGEGLKGLFTPGRVEKKGVDSEFDSEEEQERHNDPKSPTPNPSTIVNLGEKSVFSEESESPVGDNDQSDDLDNDENLENDDGLDLSVTDEEIDGRHWSGFTQDFQSSFARPSTSKDTSMITCRADPSQDPPSLGFGNVEFRVHTPASIIESKDVSQSNDVSDGSNKTLWLRMAQAEAENDRFRKLLESNNIKIESLDMGSASNLTVHDSRDMSNSRGSDYSTTDDLGLLRRRVIELEGLIELLGKRDAELQSENERKEMLVDHWRSQYNDVQKLAVQNRQRAMSLEGQVKELEQQAAVESINHDRQINEVVSKLHGEKQHSRQKSLSLEDRIKFFEQRVHEAQEAHRRDVEEKERTISHLRHALDNRRASLGPAQNPEQIIAELEGKLLEQQQAHEANARATEDKYTNLLSEKEGLVRHLQGELDEMVNLMPVDHGSSRMIDEEEVEDWLDEKSREISQYYDDGLDQIITELHGTHERVDFEEAVEEAEMSLRRVADEAGLDEPLDKATLAAFGIRQLRSEYLLLKRLLVESERRAKDLMQANEDLGRMGREAEEKLGFVEDERDAFRTAAKDAEEAGKLLVDQNDVLRAKLQEAEKHIRELVADHDALNQRCSESEERVESLEADKVSLQRLVNDTKRLNDMLKSQVLEAEHRNQGFETEITGLRKQLAEEKDHVSVVETETIAFRHQLSEWEETATAIGKQRDGLQIQFKEADDRIQVVLKEKEELSKKLLEVVKGRGDAKEADALKRQVKELQDKTKALGEQHALTSATVTQLEQKLAHADQGAQRLAAEKEFLKAELEIAAGETKAARGRFAQLLHDTAEKEAKWFGFKQEMERSITERSGNTTGTVEAYQKSLALIVQEVEKDSLHPSVSVSEHDQEGLDISSVEGIQDPELVKVVIQALRWRGRRLAESEERNKRYKGAAKKWMKENEKKRGRVEELVAEVRELGLRLKAEKKSSDEKMGQLILALRRGE